VTVYRLAEEFLADPPCLHEWEQAIAAAWGSLFQASAGGRLAIQAIPYAPLRACWVMQGERLLGRVYTDSPSSPLHDWYAQPAVLVLAELGPFLTARAAASALRQSDTPITVDDEGRG